MIQSDTKQILDIFNATPGPRMHELAPVDARAMYRQMVETLDRPPAALHRIVDLAVDAGDHAIAVRLYEPGPEPAGPVVIYMHGGGWVIGDLETHHGFCIELASQLSLRVLAVDYRLAPEHRFPAAHDDCRRVAEWVATSPPELGLPVEGLALAGDSAGGNLAVSTALQLRSQTDRRPLAQLLIYPVTDLAEQSTSYASCGEGYVLDRPMMEWFRDSYVPDERDRRDPRVSPLRADDLSDLPPTVLLTCGLDPLRDEGRAFAARLIANGTTVHFREAPGQIHGIATLRGAIQSAHAPLAESVRDFRAHLLTPAA